MATSRDAIIERLSDSQRVLITTHVRPDGDALGTSAAVHLALRSHGIASEVLLLSKLPTKYSFLMRDTGASHRAIDPPASDAPPREWYEQFDTLFVVDTGTWSQLPTISDVMKSWKPASTLVMDHHQTQEPWGDVRWVDTTASAAGEMAFDLLRAWPGVTIDQAMAEALFVAITSDTGWFAFSNTSPRTLRACAELMEIGVDTDALYQRLFQNERPERLLLQVRAMRSLAFLAQGRVARMHITNADFAETRANVPDTENLVNIPLQVADVQVSVLLSEDPSGGPVRVSLRSKGQLDVAKFAEQFGGGGHARASGAKIAAPIDEAVRRVSEALERAMA
jgi:bifunctional oligoribonuclease and PAP phosphatase NrnA